MVKLLVLITAIHLTGISSCPHTSLLIPSFNGIGHGSMVFNWLGFHATTGLGKFVTRDPSDGGLIFKIIIPTGMKALATIDGGFSMGRVYSHIMFGTESILGPGIAVGLGGSLGITGIRWGICVITATGPTRIRIYKLGKYSSNLMKISDSFLVKLDSNILKL